MLAKKIITLKDLRVTKARKSSVMSDFVAKGGGEIMHKKIQRKELWDALRTESKSRAVGKRGFTNDGLTKFFGKMLVNDADNFKNNRAIKESAELFGVKRNKLYAAAAEARIEQNAIKHQEKQLESQTHQQKKVEFRDHINDIISKGREKSQAKQRASLVSSNQGETEKTSPGNILYKFERSNSNIRTANNGNLLHLVPPHAEENTSEAYGHLKYLKNTQHDFVEEEKTDAEKIKARLAIIQGKTDNEEGKLAA